MGQGQLLSKGVTTEDAEDAEGVTLIRMTVHLDGRRRNRPLRLGVLCGLSG